MPELLTAVDVVAAVRRHYGAERDGLGPEWAALAEFSLTPAGYSYGRVDLLLIRAWSGRPKGHERHAVEVKVSRSDLAAELADPHKSWEFRAVTHRFYLATPAGLVRDLAELPDEWGLLEVTPGGVRTAREAVRHEPEPMPETALVEAFRRAARAEARIRDAAEDGGADPAARIVQLARDLASARRAADTARAAVQHEQRRVRRLLEQLTTFMPAPCACGKGDLKLAPRGGGRHGGLYVHVDPAIEHRGGWPDLDALAARLGGAAEAVAG